MVRINMLKLVFISTALLIKMHEMNSQMQLRRVDEVAKDTAPNDPPDNIDLRTSDMSSSDDGKLNEEITFPPIEHPILEHTATTMETKIPPSSKHDSSQVPQSTNDHSGSSSSSVSTNNTNPPSSMPDKMDLTFKNSFDGSIEGHVQAVDLEDVSMRSSGSSSSSKGLSFDSMQTQAPPPAPAIKTESPISPSTESNAEASTQGNYVVVPQSAMEAQTTSFFTNEWNSIPVVVMIIALFCLLCMVAMLLIFGKQKLGDEEDSDDIGDSPQQMHNKTKSPTTLDEKLLPSTDSVSSQSSSLRTGKRFSGTLLRDSDFIANAAPSSRGFDEPDLLQFTLSNDYKRDLPVVQEAVVGYNVTPDSKSNLDSIKLTPDSRNKESVINTPSTLNFSSKIE